MPARSHGPSERAALQLAAVGDRLSIEKPRHGTGLDAALPPVGFRPLEELKTLRGERLPRLIMIEAALNMGASYIGCIQI